MTTRCYTKEGFQMYSLAKSRSNSNGVNPGWRTFLSSHPAFAQTCTFFPWPLYNRRTYFWFLPRSCI
jgi:hypothetical protein